jgi:hypothetical protein
MGFLKDSYSELDHGYFYVTRLSLALACLSLLVSVYIYWDDRKTTRLLSMNVEERNNFNITN